MAPSPHPVPCASAARAGDVAKSDDRRYIEHLIAITRHHLGDEIQLYTTDPMLVVHRGTLPGPEVFSAVDFGPGLFPGEPAHIT